MQALLYHVLFSGTVILVSLSCAMHSLTQVVFVCGHVYGMCVHESFKIDGGAMVVVVPQQCFQQKSLSVLLYNKAMGTSSSLSVEGEVV